MRDHNDVKNENEKTDLTENEIHCRVLDENTTK